VTHLRTDDLGSSPEVAQLEQDKAYYMRRSDRLAEYESELDQLRETAQAAQEADPGPWEFDGRDIFTRSKLGASAHHLIVPLPETWHESQRTPVAIAMHIAACDPTTILSLLDEQVRLRETVTALTEALQAASDDARLLIQDYYSGRPEDREPVMGAVARLAYLFERDAEDCEPRTIEEIITDGLAARLRSPEQQ
jgi:hypothetical protein